MNTRSLRWVTVQLFSILLYVGLYVINEVIGTYVLITIMHVHGSAHRNVLACFSLLLDSGEVACYVGNIRSLDR